MAILMMRFVYLIRLQLVLNKQMHSVTYRGSKKKLLQKPIIRDMITQNRQRKNVHYMHYMQEKTKEMDGALTNNMEEYRTQKKAREKRLMAYAEEIQKNTLQMSSALIAELVAERKYQKKTQQDIADITGILPANIARFENGSRVPTLVVLQKYASALGKRIKVELCDQEAK